MDDEIANQLGFEIMGEYPSYEDALKDVEYMMKENKSNVVYIWNRRSGDTPFKLMLIPLNAYMDRTFIN